MASRARLRRAGHPAAVLGAHTLLTISQTIVDAALGIFFLAMVPVRRIVAARQWRVRLWQLAVAGTIVGFLTGLILSDTRMRIGLIPSILRYVLCPRNMGLGVRKRNVS